MAFLNSISTDSNRYYLCVWANGKYGAIKPNRQGKYIFYECKYDKDKNVTTPKYFHGEEDFLMPIAYGFVSFWLSKRRMKRTDQRNTFTPAYLTPKEIYFLYIKERKSAYFAMMGGDANDTNDPELEKLFYEQNLTVDSEAELIAMSQPLLDYLDIEDEAEYYVVMADFLDYVESIVKPYQEVSEHSNVTKPNTKPAKSKKANKAKKQKSENNKTRKKVTSIDPYPTFVYNYPNKTERDSFHITLRIIKVYKHLLKWEWIPKETSNDDVYDLFIGIKRSNIIKWLGCKSSTGLLGYLFRELLERNIISVPKDNDGANQWDIISRHFVDSESYPMNKERLSRDSYRAPKRNIEKINALINILDPTNIEVDAIEDDERKEILSFFNNYGLDYTDKDGMQTISGYKLSGRKY